LPRRRCWGEPGLYRLAIDIVKRIIRAGRRAQDFAAEEEAEMLGEGLAAVAELDARLARWQLQRLLGGPYDEGDAVLSIQARRPWGTACSPAGCLF